MSIPKIDYISDWPGRMAGNLYAQYKNTTTWPLMAALLGKQAQDFEDAAQTLLTLMSIDDSAGVNLVTLAALVGQALVTGDDATLRLYLRARIRANKSSSDPESIYAVFKALYNLTTTGLKYVGGWGATGAKQFELIVTPVLTPTQASVGVTFLEDSKDSGARGVLRWQEEADALLFACASVVNFLQLDQHTGDTTVNPYETEKFPAAGSAVIDFGLSTQETVTWTHKDDNLALLYLTGTLAHNHAQNSAVELVSDPGGLGWGDSSNAATGGQMTGAAQAGA